MYLQFVSENYLQGWTGIIIQARDLVSALANLHTLQTGPMHCNCLFAVSEKT